MPTPKMSLEELRQQPAFAVLTKKQRTLIEEFLSHGDSERAIRAAYPGSKTPPQIPFSKAPVKRVLALAAGETFVDSQKSALDVFKRDVQALMRTSKTTPSQIAAARLYAQLNGFAEPMPEPKPEGNIVGEKVSEMNGRRLKTVVYDVTEEKL